MDYPTFMIITQRKGLDSGLSHIHDHYKARIMKHDMNESMCLCFSYFFSVKSITQKNNMTEEKKGSNNYNLHLLPCSNSKVIFASSCRKEPIEGPISHVSLNCNYHRSKSYLSCVCDTHNNTTSKEAMNFCESTKN